VIKSIREKEAVLSVFAALMRPLMRAAFEYGISASEISALVRRTYIQALEARLSEQKRPATDARLAVVSGLAKSDVTALREATTVGAPHSLSPGASREHVAILLSVWHTHSDFSGAYGLAVELDLAPTPGSRRRSFSELVAIACPGVDQEVLLDELLATGSVEIIDSTTVRCLSRALVQKGADIKRIERMGRFLGVIAGNFVHNLLREESEPAYFERAVISDEPLSEAGRDQFLKLASDRGQELLSEFDTFLTHLAMTEKNVSGKKYGLGIYFFDDQLAATTESGQEDNLETTTRVVQEIDVLAGLPRK